MRNKFSESNHIVKWINKQTIQFYNLRMLMLVFFKDIFQQNFKVQKRVFHEISYCYITVLFNDKSQLLYYNVAVYVSVQSEKEYSLIWKAKLLTIQTDKGK